MAPIYNPDGTEVIEVVLPNGTTASEVVGPDGSTIFSAFIDDFEDDTLDSTWTGDTNQVSLDGSTSAPDSTQSLFMNYGAEITWGGSLPYSGVGDSLSFWIYDESAGEKRHSLFFGTNSEVGVSFANNQLQLNTDDAYSGTQVTLDTQMWYRVVVNIESTQFSASIYDQQGTVLASHTESYTSYSPILKLSPSGGIDGDARFDLIE